MELTDYYQTLGLAASASGDEVKRAYRKLARKYHPDVSKESDAEARMKTINEAYAVLSDADKRAAYDAMRAQPQDSGSFGAPPGWDGQAGAEGALDPDALLAQLFGRRPRAQRGADFKMRGEDLHARLAIDLRDAYQGALRELSLQGHGPGPARVLQVRVPAGVKDGQQLRLAGQGGAGYGGAPAGDLFLALHIQPSAQYRVDGRDVHQRLPVTPWEAALGAGIEVATPAGTLHVSVPAGSQAGRKLRLKGRGIPGQPPGDLYLLLEVVLPAADTDQAKTMYASMAQAMPFDPRRTMGEAA